MVKKAAEFAEKVHQGAVRKGTTIPYITHPLDTAVIVSLITKEEELIAAAILHDTMEDAGISFKELEQRFGTRVAELVAEETEDKSKSWQERKAATLKHLETAGRQVKILTLADKLSNMRTTARDYMLIGDEIWQRFNVKEKEKHAWYYLSMIERLKDLEELPQYQEYVKLCRMVFGE